MENISIKINGLSVDCTSGETVLEAAERAGIEIPSLCRSELVKNYGACGLCVVEDAGSPKLIRACSAAVRDGMDISTESERVKKSRALALELLLSDHDGDCVGPCSLNCPAGTDCHNQRKAAASGLDRARLPAPVRKGVPQAVR